MCRSFLHDHGNKRHANQRNVDREITLAKYILHEIKLWNNNITPLNIQTDDSYFRNVNGFTHAKMDSLTSSLKSLQTNHKLQQTSSSNKFSELTCPFQWADGFTDLDQTTTTNTKKTNTKTCKLNTKNQTKTVNSTRTNSPEPNQPTITKPHPTKNSNKGGQPNLPKPTVMGFMDPKWNPGCRKIYVK